MNQLEQVVTNLQCELVAERNKRNPQNISWLQYDSLVQLSIEKEMLPSKISVLLGISRTKLSKALKELKVMNYIQQRPSDKDGRELITFLTEEGKQLVMEIDNGHAHLFQVADSVFDKKEKELFNELTKKYLIALREERLKSYD